ncbi:MAG: hypothetical protein WBA28_02770 [Microbacteriaceae bacterium]
MTDFHDMQHFGNGKDGKIAGDCYRACLATITRLQPEQLRHYAQDCPDSWWPESQKDVKHLTGLQLECFVTGSIPPENEGLLAIGVGKSPRGDWKHAVVIDPVTLRVVHDPHPSRAGIDGPIIEIYALVVE